MSRGTGVTPQEQEAMDVLYPHALDITSVVGVAQMPGLKSPVSFVQIVHPPGTEFPEWPEKIQHKIGSMYSGEEDPVVLLVFYEPDKIMTPLLATAYDAEQQAPFFDLLRATGFYVVEIWTEKHMARAMVDDVTGKVHAGPRREVTAEDYEQTRSGENIRPTEELGRVSRGGSA